MKWLGALFSRRPRRVYYVLETPTSKVINLSEAEAEEHRRRLRDDPPMWLETIRPMTRRELAEDDAF